MSTSADSGSSILAAQQSRNTTLNQILTVLKTLGIQLGAKSTSATAGSATLPANPVGFVTVTFSDGSSGKLPYYAT
jgi:hypothetical protein